MKEKRREGLFFDMVYRVVARCWMTKGYVKRVTNTLHSVCPMDRQKIRKLVAELCLLVLGLDCLAFYVLFVRSPGIYSVLVFVFYAVVIAKETLRFFAGRMEYRLLRQTEKMLNDVRHCFFDTHSVTEALQEVAGISGYEIRLHIENLLEVLCSEDVEAAVEEYNQSSENRFLKLFLSQCVAIREYGDTEVKDESMFVRNLCDLREDVLNHQLQLERLRVEFAGLSFITLVPLLMLPIMRSAAIGMLPELARFYNGTLGKVLPMVFLAGTIMIYNIIVEMQELDARGDNSRWLWQIEKCGMVAWLLNRWERRHYGKAIQQKRKLRRGGEKITPRLFFLEKVVYMYVAVVFGILVLLWAKKGGESIAWYEGIILLLCGIVSYWIPEIRIRYRKSLMQMNMLSEVTQFQSIIMMQMFIPDITVLRILTTLEQFAHIFHASIQDCINEYSYSVQGALQRMKGAESYEPFRRLCDKLLSVDKIGIVRSFEEIVQDRLYFQKQREADTYRVIKKKSGYARIIAFIPVLLIVITYLVLPYGVEALRQFSMILEEINRI